MQGWEKAHAEGLHSRTNGPEADPLRSVVDNEASLQRGSPLRFHLVSITLWGLRRYQDDEEAF